MKLNILPALILLFTTAFSTFVLAQSNEGIKNKLELGETYKKAEYGDWILRCIRTNSKKIRVNYFSYYVTTVAHQ